MERGEGAASSHDMADLEMRRVRAVPLLLQLGLLSSEPVKPQRCRLTLNRPMITHAPPCSACLQWPWRPVRMDSKTSPWLWLGSTKALTLRSPAALAEAVEAIFLRLPQSGEKEELYYCKSPLGLSHPKDMWARHSH